MSKTELFIKRSIGKKQIAAISAILLCLFSMFHMCGNYFLLYGREAFDGFVHMLHALKYLLYVLEAGLAATFLAHIVLGIKLWRENRKARESRYEAPEASQMLKGARGAASPGSLTMIFTGLVFTVFLVLHVYHFTITSKVVTPDVPLYDIVATHLSKPFWAFFYVFSVSCLGVHLTHGLQSAFQTLGFAHSRYMPGLKVFSVGFGIFIGAGYSVLPLYFLFG